MGLDNLIENSKVRLERLGYFKEVNVETIPVPGTEDQVDIEFSVEEESTSSIGGSIGYSDFGLNLGLNLQDQNFLGTGNRVSIGLKKVFIKNFIVFHSLIPISLLMV